MYRNRKGNLILENETKSVFWQLRHYKNPIIYGAFSPDGFPCLVMKVGKKDIPINESENFIFDCGGFKKAIERIRSWGFSISAITEKPVVISLLS